MHLKSLELMGFKSFGRKTVFDFMPGLTAIIGPNGSGKSNVCDAIRWVLGEQSAKALRGTKMSEVIFAGSSEIRPSSFAQVKLVLDNEDHSMPVDFTEVSIGRQLFRSGESNYIVNNTRTLLGNVKELLMDTGIGKDGYSVIGQGDIDDIIFQRIQPRRVLIEEAAGITRFKHRKQSAMTKLDHTRANMTRITDIISEIESQLGPLAEQAEKTRKYQILAAEIRQLEIDLVLFDLNQLYSERENIGSMRVGLLDKIAEIEQFLTEVEEKRNSAKAKYDEFNSILKERQDKVSDITKQIDSHRDEISLLMQQIKADQGRCNGIRDELNNIEGSIYACNDEISDAENRLRDEETEETKLSDKSSEVEANLASVKKELDDHLASAAADKESSMNVAMRISALKTNNNLANQQITMLQNQLSRGDSDVSTAKETINNLKKQISDLEKDITSLSADIELNQKQLATENSRLASVEKDCKNKEDELISCGDQIKLNKSRRAILEDAIHNDRSGIYRGVQAALALKQTGRLQGINGIVGDLIKVPKGYELAIETALGASIQNIVTRDAETAKQAIAILKQNKAGKATFMPLDMMNAPQALSKPMATGCLGVALNIVQFEAKYYTAMSNLLGRVLIFDNIDNAVAFARTSRNFNRIVTLEGEIVMASGAMTGGGEDKKQAGILVRRQQLDEMTTMIAGLEIKERNLKIEFSKLKAECQQLTESTRNRENSIGRSENSLSFLNSRIEQARMDLETKQRDFDNITSDRKELTTSIANFQKQVADATKELETLEKQNKDLADALESKKDVEAAIQSRFNALLEMSGNQKVKMAAIVERIKAIKKEISDAQKRRKEREERKQRANEDVANLEKNCKDNEQKVTALQGAMETLSQNRDVINEAIAAVQNDYAAMTQEMEQLNRTYQSRANIKESHRKKLGDLDIKLAEINTNINNKEGILAGNYSYNEDPTQFNPRKYDGREELSGMISQKEFEKAALGTVNPLAIEDYEKTKERYDLLNNQVKDMTEAAASLEALIDEIEKTSSEKFLETFELINKSFTAIFEILFPGGSGTLKLSEKDDPLNSNVDVVCRLPGKKLTTLELFSGGEKSMISLALLFAILEVKPPAFCLLDEVEAALDEANVKRFNRMLRSFADKVQFLVITHNKETMQTVDVIYGVTMQKGGCSKQISIRLEDNDKIKEFTVGKSGKPQEREIKLKNEAA